MSGITLQHRSSHRAVQQFYVETTDNVVVDICNTLPLARASARGILPDGRHIRTTSTSTKKRIYSINHGKRTYYV